MHQKQKRVYLYTGYSYFIENKWLTDSQIPCSSYEASIWMEQTIAQFETKDKSRNKLMILQRLNQQKELEEYTVDALRED